MGESGEAETGLGYQVVVGSLAKPEATQRGGGGFRPSPRCHQRTWGTCGQRAWDSAGTSETHKKPPRASSSCLHSAPRAGVRTHGGGRWSCKQPTRVEFDPHLCSEPLFLPGAIPGVGISSFGWGSQRCPREQTVTEDVACVHSEPSPWPPLSLLKLSTLGKCQGPELRRRRTWPQTQTPMQEAAEQQTGVSLGRKTRTKTGAWGRKGQPRDMGGFPFLCRGRTSLRLAFQGGARVPGLRRGRESSSRAAGDTVPQGRPLCPGPPREE